MHPVGLLNMSKDIFGCFLANSSLSTIQICTRVSKEIKSITIEVTRIGQEKELKNFIGTIVGQLNLSKDARLVASVQDIGSKLDFSKCSNLSQLKKKILAVKELMIVKLETSDQETLINLSKISPPSFCENVFQIAEFYRQKNIAMGLSKGSEQFIALQSIMKEMKEKGLLEEALKIARTYPNLPRIAALRELAKAFSGMGASAKASAITQELPVAFQSLILKRDSGENGKTPTATHQKSIVNKPRLT